MKALDSELFKDAPSNGILKVHQSMVCKNQNPTLPLNRAQKEENINKRKKSMVELASWGGGQEICTRDLRVPCEGGRWLSQDDRDNSLSV